MMGRGKIGAMSAHQAAAPREDLMSPTFLEKRDGET